MTRRAFQIWFSGIATIYFLLIMTGILLYGEEAYDLFKDLVPLATALPAAILAGVYQRRSSFLNRSRAVWVSLVDAVQDAIQFTHLESPSKNEYSSLMKKISFVIDDFRSLYTNLDDKVDGIGFYPFESIKRIQRSLGIYYEAGTLSESEQRKIRDHIIALWKQSRDPILKEFDRLEPTYFDTPYKDVYEVQKQNSNSSNLNK